MQQGKNFKGKTSWKTYFDRFFIVAFVKIIAAFVNAFAIWPRKEKKKKTIAMFLKRSYRQIQKMFRGLWPRFKRGYRLQI